MLGPNGAGKSTLIGILAGLGNKTSGQVIVNGYDLEKDSRKVKQSIGVVPQELVMDPYFTPRETLDIQAGYYGITKKFNNTDKILSSLGLIDKANAYSRSLSGGMKRRLMIAKAMVHSPSILILDEPTAGVDVELRKSLWNNIKLLNKLGTTIMLTTHYLEEAEAICDNIAIINNGKIITKGNTSSLISELDKKELIITLSENIKKLPNSLTESGFLLINDNIISAIYQPSILSAGDLIKKVYKEKMQIKDVTTKEPKLEELFVKLVK